MNLFYRIFSAILLAALLSFNLSAQDKKPLNHDDYDIWKSIKNTIISDNGLYVSYEINPQEGDGTLWIYDTEGSSYLDFARGYEATFSPGDEFLAFRIKARFDSIRQAKLDGKKKDDLPKDSLGVYLIEKDSLVVVPDIKSFKVPEEGKAWVAWLLEKKHELPDTTATDTTATEETEEKSDNKKTKKPKKQEGKTMEVYHPGTGVITSFDHVTGYDFSKNGQMLSFITTKKDSIDSVFVHYMLYPGIQSRMIYAGPGYAKLLTPDEDGMQLAYLFTADTGKVKVYGLKLWNINNDKLITAADTSAVNMPDGWCVSENGKLYFSGNGKRLFFGTAAIPQEEPEDTLTSDEKVSVDIWNWKDDRLQPMQLKQKDSDLKRSYMAVYHIPPGRMVQLADEDVMNLRMDKKRQGPFALGSSRKPYYKEMSWDADGKQDYYLINMDNGKRILLLEKMLSGAYLSPLGRYVTYYDALDSSWNSILLKSGEHKKLTGELPVCFSYEEYDMPSTPGPYGFKGWSKNEDWMLVYDRYDLWKLDPEGKDDPVNLTNGRDKKKQYRYYNLNPDIEYIPENEDLLLRVFNEKNKDAGFCHLNIGKEPVLNELMSGPYSYYIPKKAREADKLIWQRMNFTEYPDLYVSDMDFDDPVRVTHANPQQNEYLWGSVELVHWTSSNGDELEGLLYKPENFDPDSTYPMIVYFYEKYSNSLNRHYTPRPSRSTVNFTYYASNGYLVFVPDIVYEEGFPGQSAFHAVVSGTLNLMENPWVDSDHIGIQGQSWGGYQVAYLVTQTNMFAAAMAGAPVSNMTSAYGGIRWGSGMSRMFQYEGSQSRIGGTLWERPWRYIENSPVFFADKVETPLLMMHNDKDGAVPWYQGIEYFVALRRLGKPVWMLTYNGAPHNLKRRADCKDLSIRMQQFFDHYLKGAPAPVWMEYGIPAVEKGKKMGYELIKD